MKNGFKILIATTVAVIVGFSMMACPGGEHLFEGNYSVTINNGNGSGSYPAGSTVTISANVPAGQQFIGWTVNGGGAVLANPSNPTTSFTMPAASVTITATFTSDGGTSSNSGGGTSSNSGGGTSSNSGGGTSSNSGGGTSSNSGGGTSSNSGGTATYHVTVVNGTLSNGLSQGDYAPGATVTIKATVQSGQQFANWTVTSGNTTVASPTSQNTTFIMPAAQVTVTANVTGSGGSSVNTTFTIVNNTDYNVPEVYVKASTSNSWGTDRETGTLGKGASKTYTLVASSATEEYDIFLRASSTNQFVKYKVLIPDGAIFTFTADDYNTGSSLPSIIIRNRTGVSISSIRIKPSGTNTWTLWEKTISNNSQSTIDLQIPVTNYNTYDFELISGNPVNTFIKNNVEIVNGTIVTITSATTASPITGEPNIVIENHTGGSTYHLYIKVAGATDWGTDLHSGSIGNNQSYAVLINKSFLNQRVDVKVSSCNSSCTSNSTHFVKSDVLLTEGVIFDFTTLDKQ